MIVLMFYCLAMSQMYTEEKPTERFVLPEKLIQKIVIVAPDEKPLVVLYFLLELKYARVLCFTKSIENTHRYFEIVWVAQLAW